MSPYAFAPRPRVPAALHARRHWFACRTRARAEKRALELLQRRGVEAWLPLVEEERAWSDRTKHVHVPLYSGYVFTRIELTRIHDALRVPQVVDVAAPNGYPTPVRPADMDALRRMVEGANDSGTHPEPASYHLLSAGDEVVVSAGPFEGMRGVLVRDEEGGRRRAARVAVRIEALRQASSVLVPRGACRVVEGARGVVAGGEHSGESRGTSFLSFGDG